MIPEMLPICCQSLNKYACAPHKCRLLQTHFITQTRKIKFSSIQFCIGDLVPFDFIFFQLSHLYGLSPLVLSSCKFQVTYFCKFSSLLKKDNFNIWYSSSVQTSLHFLSYSLERLSISFIL